ncbi:MULTISPECIES: hypothetical protein [Micromonospora]|uniref:Uncharacterized protein n=1 Tax=Micromonospora humida TaxID=2809018 RepID=A0ABS2IKS6_9ACTN|nr:hypothetical protein [Micromonospora humida]MBM7074952.1 hypothetical protein [Micromonospora humida]
MTRRTALLLWSSIVPPASVMVGAGLRRRSFLPAPLCPRGGDGNWWD